MNDTSITYSHEKVNSLYEGVLFKEEYAKEYLKTRVSRKYYDLEGTQTLVNDFSSIGEIGFSKDILEEIFDIKPNLKDWKIGECMAECYLEDNHNVRFYYEPSRDAKNHEGNLHGADIVGFSELKNEIVFVFGEVKTSMDKNSPPGVMYGSSGMICQLENIRDDDSLRESLIRWLAFKVEGKDDDDHFKNDFVSALQTYIKSKKKKLKLVGILIRNTEPNEKDVESGYANLIPGMDPKMFLSISVIYLPLQIDMLSNYLKKEGK